LRLLSRHAQQGSAGSRGDRTASVHAERLEGDSLFSERERAALAWTEAITLISSSHASDEIYEEVRKGFTEEELVNLTLAIVAINGWNRPAIGFRSVPGTYQPAVPQNGATTGKS
jgi:alkylhydroperoxidase family enzyme